MKQSNELKILNRSVKWKKSETESIELKDMHTNHIIRCLQFIAKRRELSKEIKDLVPVIYHDEFLKRHNGKSYDEWLLLFSAELELRAKEATDAKRAELEAELEALESSEEKIKRLKSELEKLS